MAEVEGYRIPDDLYYHPEHMWVRREEGIIRVGLDDFSQKLSGELSFIELPDAGSDVEADQIVGHYETGKWMGKLFAPVSGEILEANSELEDDPTLVNSEPYGKGWMFTMKPSDISALEGLMQGEDAASWLGEEAKKHGR